MQNTVLIPHLFQEELYRIASPVVVVLPREWAAYSAEDKVLLDKILTSVKVNMDAVLILHRPNLAMDDLHLYAPAQVLVFGSELPADVPHYQTVTAQGFSVIRADDLTALDEVKKKNLWMALRKMFAL